MRLWRTQILYHVEWYFFYVCVIIPSLTLVKAKNGYRPCNYAVCSHFLFGSDLCYFFTFPVLVFFMMLRIADFEINS